MSRSRRMSTRQAEEAHLRLKLLLDAARPPPPPTRGAWLEMQLTMMLGLVCMAGGFCVAILRLVYLLWTGE